MGVVVLRGNCPTNRCDCPTNMGNCPEGQMSLDVIVLVGNWYGVGVLFLYSLFKSLNIHPLEP